MTDKILYFIARRELAVETFVGLVMEIEQQKAHVAKIVGSRRRKGNSRDRRREVRRRLHDLQMKRKFTESRIAMYDERISFSLENLLSRMQARPS